MEWQPTKPAVDTPWGALHAVKDYGSGIKQYTTASHGGFHVPADMRVQMPAALQSHRCFNNYTGWYEEDCDWAVVALAFPDLFTPQNVMYAIETVVGWSAEYFGAVRAWLKTAEALEVCRIAAEYENSQMVTA